MSNSFFEFLADNGRRYFIAGTTDRAILSITNEGTEPGKWFSNFASSGIKKFLSYREVSAQYVQENCSCSHYVNMAEGYFRSSPCVRVFWIGTQDVVQPVKSN